MITGSAIIANIIKDDAMARGAHEVLIVPMGDRQLITIDDGKGHKLCYMLHEIPVEGSVTLTQRVKSLITEETYVPAKNKS